MIWTEEHNAYLRERIAAGDTGGMARAALNARFGLSLSRSAIIARAYRLGLRLAHNREVEAVALAARLTKARELEAAGMPRHAVSRSVGISQETLVSRLGPKIDRARKPAATPDVIQPQRPRRSPEQFAAVLDEARRLEAAGVGRRVISAQLQISAKTLVTHLGLRPREMAAPKPVVARDPVPKPPTPIRLEVVPANTVSIYELTAKTCRWPDGGRAPYRYCGCQPLPGKPYCAPHQARAFDPAPPRKSSVPSDRLNRRISRLALARSS